MSYEIILRSAWIFFASNFFSGEPFIEVRTLNKYSFTNWFNDLYQFCKDSWTRTVQKNMLRTEVTIRQKLHKNLVWVDRKIFTNCCDRLHLTIRNGWWGFGGWRSWFKRLGGWVDPSRASDWKIHPSTRFAWTRFVKIILKVLVNCPSCNWNKPYRLKMWLLLYREYSLTILNGFIYFSTIPKNCTVLWAKVYNIKIFILAERPKN